MKVLAALIVFMFAALTARLWFLQVLAAPQFARAAAQNQVRLVPIAPVRGLIMDAQGHVLVGNRGSLAITIDRQQLGSAGPVVIRRLSALLKVPAAELQRNLDNLQYLPYQPVPVAENVSKDQVFYVREHQDLFPGVGYQMDTIRSYPYGSLAAQTLGHVGLIQASQVKAQPSLKRFPPTTTIGQAGLEQVYDSYLRGHPGKQEVQVNAQGQVLDSDFGTIPAKAGDNLVLSLDAGVQQLASQSLEQGLVASRSATDVLTGAPLNAHAGAVVVMNPRNGRVLAMVSDPSYNPSVWVNGLSTQQYKRLQGTPDEPGPLLNRAIQNAYPPGSTFKPFIAMAALEQGYITPQTSLDCPGQWQVPGDTSKTIFHNWTTSDLGYMNLSEALIESCDTFFYQLGYRFWQSYVGSGYNVATGKGGTEYLQRYLDHMGFGKPTGVDLPSEIPGVIPTNAYKKALDKSDPQVYGNLPWLPGDDVNMAIGQGFVTVTPLQLAVGYSAIANGGTIYAPRLGWKIESPNGKVVRVVTPPKVGTLPVSKQNIAVVRQALEGVPERGTAAVAFAGFPFSRVLVAGKTGTAEITGRQPYSWFAAMAPANHPKYVVVCMVEQGGEGGTTAAPVVRRILDGLFGLGVHKVTAGSNSD